MTIRYDLATAHADYRRLAPEILTSLDERWPGACELVTLHDPDSGDDRSLGCVCTERTISLNRRWFTQPASELIAAARLGASTAPDWHASAPEPDHVLVHEFGHCLRSFFGDDAKRFAEEGHAAVLADPSTAPTGYSLATSEEFYAEAFMLALLSDDANHWVERLRKTLKLA